MKTPRMSVTAKKAMVFADMVRGVKVNVTAKRVKLSKTRVVDIRNEWKQLIPKELDPVELKRQAIGMSALTYENIIYFLMHRDKEVTLACAKGMGLIPKDYDDFKELLAAMAAVAGGSNHTHYHLGADANRDGNLFSIFGANNGNGNGTGHTNRLKQLSNDN